KTAGFNGHEKLQRKTEEENPIQLKRIGTGSFIQKKCADCKKEDEEIQRKPFREKINPAIQAKDNPTVSDDVANGIHSTKGCGSALDSNTNSFMNSRFGIDFSNIKIHTDSEVVQLSRELNAKAFTVGNDIYFNQGHYDPGSSAGKQLLAHELTHSVQQLYINDKVPTVWRSGAETVETETVGREVARAEHFRPEHVVQGRVSDCYLLAALIALTNSVRGRARLAETIQTADNETFQVTLFLRPIPGGPFVPRAFSVGGFTHPENEGAPSRAAPWVRAVERAYAQLYGGRIQMSGDSGGILIGGAQRALEHLTGEEASRLLITTETDRDQLWTQMSTALGQGLPVVAGTSQRADNPDNNALGVYGVHNYSVLAVRGNGSGRQVRIHNPWGQRNRQSPPGIEADFEIDFALFAEYFVHLTVGYQSETPGLESGISGISAPTEETIERGFFETQREQMLHFLRISDVESASRLLGRLIRQVSVRLTPPAPLRARLITNLRINTQIAQETSHVAASVDSRYAFENPDDYWRWIEFGFGIIGQTEAYTRNSIAHELQHCADIAHDLRTFATLPRPHTPERFIEYARTRSSSRERHTEIYAQMAAPENFVRWGPRDRIDWLHGALMELPLHVPSHQRLAVEETIEQFYASSPSEIQENIWREIQELTMGEVQRARASSQATQLIAYGRARTILDHFSSIWSDRGPQRDIIERNIIRNTTPDIQRH
ncbi:MAG: DUF4157 domain-containing protein, partial [Anditalea sp.]